MTLYDSIGVGYSRSRCSDPRWLASVLRAVGTGSVVNVGAGAGSYEPPRTVVAVEPSLRMLAQRPAGLAPAVQGVAEGLPLGSGSVDVALAVLTVHHWSDWRRGLAELRRVAGRQVVLTYEPALHADYWLTREYIPEVALLERSRPSVADIAGELSAPVVSVLPVPWDFQDGVYPAHWRRPAAYLDPRVRGSCSALAQTSPSAVARGIARLEADLASGAWAARHADLLALPVLDVGFRLITAGA
ncbi:class I SAM-dependent methyltransferase [Amycolatopsis rhabdoformis]|uniref:Class I SAM-dependent methyltransferase n=1 Tax=Amycolatopsis rhabdoformis TaxID=1448059 RepID=A0ABZ1HXV3_9PSEU|nr:class I SAM-dependent methyltransferase [Amycolatopsis rhabdoformis]WSE26387.1 class I SAM-dependent methyltransferase [Amycolatopsis rhabdoformis]